MGIVIKHPSFRPSSSKRPSPISPGACSRQSPRLQALQNTLRSKEILTRLNARQDVRACGTGVSDDGIRLTLYTTRSAAPSPESAPETGLEQNPQLQDRQTLAHLENLRSQKIMARLKARGDVTACGTGVSASGIRLTLFTTKAGL
ncbi:hypothetical protein F66182_3712 [Fusarium sp. NRRL 66182]|nr:hypothetical protein F66182_3712 [Fusarium sp. NRRL 66182]